MGSANICSKRSSSWKVRSLVALGVAFLVGVAACSEPEPSLTNPPGSGDDAIATTATSTNSTTSTTTTTTTTTTTLPSEPRIIELTADSAQGDVVAAVDSDGHLVVSFYAPEEEAIGLLRCVDPACEEPPSVIFLDFVGYSEPIDMVVRPDGRPIVIAQSEDFLSAALYDCEDPDCNLAGFDEFIDEAPCIRDDGSRCSRASFVQMALAPDGLPRVAYYHANPPALNLAVCGDPTCLPENRSTVVIDDDLLEGYDRPSLHIAPTGRVLIGYGTEDAESSEARVAVCDDDTCSSGPTIHRLSNASAARMTSGEVEEFLVWYVSGHPEEMNFDDVWGTWSESADIMVAVCSPDGCAESVRVEAGEDWLLPWSGMSVFKAPDSATWAVFNHMAQDDPNIRLRLTRCADLTCSSAVTEELDVDEVFGSSYDVVVHEDSLWVVFAAEAGGLRLLEVPLDE